MGFLKPNHLSFPPLFQKHPAEATNVGFKIFLPILTFTLCIFHFELPSLLPLAHLSLFGEASHAALAVQSSSLSIQNLKSKMVQPKLPPCLALFHLRSICRKRSLPRRLVLLLSKPRPTPHPSLHRSIHHRRIKKVCFRNENLPYMTPCFMILGKIPLPTMQST